MDNFGRSRQLSLANLAFAGFVSCGFSNLSAQELYKCVGSDGKTTYQAVPCSGADKRGSIKQSASGPVITPSSPGMAKSEAVSAASTAASTTDAQKLKGMQTLRRSNDLKADIENAQSNISLFRSQMDRELNMLRERKNSSRNNLAGATWEQSISTEMQAVVATYETKIKIEESKVRQFQNQLADLEKQK